MPPVHCAYYFFQIYFSRQEAQFVSLSFQNRKSNSSQNLGNDRFQLLVDWVAEWVIDICCLVTVCLKQRIILTRITMNGIDASVRDLVNETHRHIVCITN